MVKKQICDKAMSFDECELAILRLATDKAEKDAAREMVNTPDVKKLINIIENFLKMKKLIVYGGTAINALLPKEDQFYDREYELPDYDFFSVNPLDDTKELCDVYMKAGFLEVEGKSGVHEGTYKVFVNFIPVADITYLHRDIYRSIKQDAIRIAGIYYCPPNYLRMSMYLELSRPAGDVSRWEKVLKRLVLFNKHYPLKAEHCNTVDFQRKMDDKSHAGQIYETVKDTLIDQGCVFFGGYAMRLYAHYMPKAVHRKFENNPDFDVLSEQPQTVAYIVKERLTDLGLKGVKIIKKPAIGEIVAPHYEVRIETDTVAFIYEPISCHSFNTIHLKGRTIKIATIDTMLSFYLAFLYAARAYYDPKRILCMAQYLFKLQQENRLKQTGLLRRFSTDCYGHQLTLEEIRARKSEKFIELKDRRGTKEFETVFFRYRPVDNDKDNDNDNDNTNEDTKGKDAKAKKANVTVEAKTESKGRHGTRKQHGKNKKNKNNRKKSRKEKTRKRGRGGLFL
jgi:hypothetical protein